MIRIIHTNTPSLISPMSFTKKFLDPPPLYPKYANFPAPPKLTAYDKATVEKGRNLAEHFRYSGYYVTKELVSGVERYTDQYRRQEGKRDAYDEIEPSTEIFPRELLFEFKSRSSGGAQGPMFMSASAIDQRLGGGRPDDAAPAKAKNKAAQGKGSLRNLLSEIKDGGDDDDEEPVADETMEEEEEVGNEDYNADQYMDYEDGDDYDDDDGGGDGDEATF